MNLAAINRLTLAVPPLVIAALAGLLQWLESDAEAPLRAPANVMAAVEGVEFANLRADGPPLRLRADAARQVSGNAARFSRPRLLAEQGVFSGESGLANNLQELDLRNMGATLYTTSQGRLSLFAPQAIFLLESENVKGAKGVTLANENFHARAGSFSAGGGGVTLNGGVRFVLKDLEAVGGESSRAE